MGVRLRTALLICAPLFAALASGCGLPRYQFSDLQLPVREGKMGSLLSAEGRLLALNASGTALLEIDPDTLKWRDTRIGRRVRDFDLTEAGLWVIDAESLRLYRPDRAPIRLASRPSSVIWTGWTARYVVVSSDDGVRFVPREATSLPPLVRRESTRPVAVDYHNERLWGLDKDALYSLGPEETEWTRAEIRSQVRGFPREYWLSEGLKTLTFGRRWFAFMDGQTIFAGRSDLRRLLVEQSIALPEDIESIAFNSRDGNLLLARSKTSLWTWNLDLRTGRRWAVRPGAAAWMDRRRGRLVSVNGPAIAQVGENGEAVRSTRIRLDGPARACNSFWKILWFPVDLLVGIATFMTPAGLVFQ